jgi:hypothetical protein
VPPPHRRHRREPMQLTEWIAAALGVVNVALVVRRSV